MLFYHLFIKNSIRIDEHFTAAIEEVVSSVACREFLYPTVHKITNIHVTPGNFSSASVSPFGKLRLTFAAECFIL